MGRCGCGNGSCGCAISSTDCLAVTGAGTAADPFEVAPVLSAEVPNLLECQADGLFARATPEAWTDWTPTYTNMTAGNGTTTYARYARVGRWIAFELRFTLGSTSTIGTVPTFTLPVQAAARYNDNSRDLIGDVLIFDSGTAGFRGSVMWRSSTTAGLLVGAASGSYTNHVDVTSTVPMTWTTNDSFTAKGWYEAAA